MCDRKGCFCPVHVVVIIAFIVSAFVACASILPHAIDSNYLQVSKHRFNSFGGQRNIVAPVSLPGCINLGIVIITKLPNSFQKLQQWQVGWLFEFFRTRI